MPIKVPDNLPAKEILNKENIFVMGEKRAFHQDIRPLKIVILNLMPKKQEAEVQLLRMLSNSPLQVDITFLRMESYTSKNTSIDYLDAFYKIFSEIKDKKFDGMIITGAPVEHLDFEQITYWKELSDIMMWSKLNVTSTLHICWGALAGLYYHYKIPKYNLPKKMFGVFEHTRIYNHCDLLRGFDDIFYVPHSRHAEIRRKDIDKVKELEILAESTDSGVYIISAKDGKQIFVTGHPEYDSNILKNEYLRDKNKGLEIEIPKNYFKDDDPTKNPIIKWKSHSNLLFSNWLNYYVYQITPYEL